MNPQLDETDWQIVRLLRQEHDSNNSIARQLGLSEGTVRNRLKRLKEAGVLEVRALLNPEAIDGQQLVFIGLCIKESRQLRTMAERIAALPGVHAVSIVSGRFDLLAEILVDSNRGLVQFVTETLSQVDGIASTESFVVLRSYEKWV